MNQRRVYLAIEFDPVAVEQLQEHLSLDTVRANDVVVELGVEDVIAAYDKVSVLIKEVSDLNRDRDVCRRQGVVWMARRGRAA